MKIISLVLIMFLFGACGYTPSAKFSREVVGEKISTSVVISAVDPENTVIVKDAVDAAIIQVFHASLTDSSSSKTHLVLTLSNPSYSAIQYDSNGYVIMYRTTVSLSILRQTNGKSKTYTAKGTYDFSIDPNAIISDKQRFDSIRFSANKAIRSFIAQVSAEGSRGDEDEEENKKID
jgi:CHAT domain-containing protein